MEMLYLGHVQWISIVSFGLLRYNSLQRSWIREEDNMSVPEIMTAITIFDRILAAVGSLKTDKKADKKERSERTDKALYALYAAVNETKAYISYLESGKRRNRKREFAIARLWHDASVPLRTVDRDLARRCFLKGSYWLEPDTWSELVINKKRIGLDQIIKSTRALLMESS